MGPGPHGYLRTPFSIKDVCSGIGNPGLGFPLPSLVNKAHSWWLSGRTRLCSAGDPEYAGLILLGSRRSEEGMATLQDSAWRMPWTVRAWRAYLDCKELDTAERQTFAFHFVTITKSEFHTALTGGSSGADSSYMEV